MKKEKTSAALPQGEASTLEHFVRHETEHRPDAVSKHAAHRAQPGGMQAGVPVTQKKHGEAVKSGAPANMILSACRMQRAQESGALHGALYYAGVEQPPRLQDGRYQESEDTVLAKMNSKEKFPQG